MSKPLGFHVICRLLDSRIAAPTPETRRVLSRIVLSQGKEHALLAHNTVDTHLHMLPVCDRRAAGELTRRVEIQAKLKLRLDVGFATPRFEPIRGQWHLANTFDYILGQHPHHGLDWDPFFEASNLPDLLGLRVIGAYTANNVRRLLPRIHREHLLAWLQVAELEPADGPPTELVQATLAAAGLGTLRGKNAETLAAKRALVQVAGPATATKVLSDLLGLSSRGINLLREGLRQRPADERLVMAIRLQLGLRRIRAAASEGPFGETPRLWAAGGRK
jgi:hypothetical protein